MAINRTSLEALVSETMTDSWIFTIRMVMIYTQLYLTYQLYPIIQPWMNYLFQSYDQSIAIDGQDLVSLCPNDKLLQF